MRHPAPRLLAALFACALACPSPAGDAIADNSFLVEEAYNQEPGVAQHISVWQRDNDSGAWVYSFTQEWPAPGQRHQLSYTIPWVHPEDPGRAGLGDVAVNYRLQLAGIGGGPVAFAPRVSLLFPTGSEKKGTGAGAAGVQVNLPLSLSNENFAAHFNAGGTWTPRARNDAGDRADTRTLSGGASVIWLAAPRFNVMLEGAWSRNESVIGAGAVERTSSGFISPGIRWAHNLRGDLQIVPGIAFPIGVGASRGERQVLLYVSFEAPFRRAVP